MSKRSDEARLAAVRRALELTTEALDLLDAHGGPPDAAAYLALAQDRLRFARGADG